MSGINPKDLVGARKAPLRYVPAALAIEAAGPMDDGQRKYGAYNWRETPILMSGYIEAMERHLAALKDGQDFAEDSGYSHVGHIAAGAAILADAKAHGTLIDDRHKGPAADMLRERDKSTKPPPVVSWDEAGSTPFEDFLAAVEGLKNAPPPTLLLKQDEPTTVITPLADGHRIETIIPFFPDQRAPTGGYPYPGTGDSGYIHGMPSDEWDRYGSDNPTDGSSPYENIDRSAFVYPVVTAENRGDWPLDTRVAGLLTCCGQTEHTIACPQWR